MRTIREAALAWGVSYTVVRKWIAQGRLEVTRLDRKAVILSEERPPALTRGELRERVVVWNRGKKKGKRA